MKLILASQSPRRKEILESVGLNFDIMPVDADESLPEGIECADAVTMLARRKARALAEAHPELSDCVILAADTLVECFGEILGKPIDEKDAFRMLKALSGNTHQVYTGVCILYPLSDGRRKKRFFSVCTQVAFFPLSDEQILSYIATGSPMDKAGAYGIQDGGLVESIEGSFSNVVGLPQEACKNAIELLRKTCK